jgi:hypothetical protein
METGSFVISEVLFQLHRHLELPQNVSADMPSTSQSGSQDIALTTASSARCDQIRSAC